MNAPPKSPASQAVKRHRERLAEAGIVRFEIKAPAEHKELIQQIAHALTSGPDADAVHRNLEAALTPPTRTKGQTLRWLLDSPLAGADIDFTRERVEPREVKF